MKVLVPDVVCGLEKRDLRITVGMGPGLSVCVGLAAAAPA